MAKRANNNTGEPRTQMAHGPACKYNPLSHPQTAQAMAKLGARIVDIAEAFGITSRTLYMWLTRFPELRAAVDAGNAVFDTKVERALAERAIGYFASWEDEMINPMTGAKEPLKRHKYIEPNIAAIRLWLTNRKPDEWKKTQRQQIEIKRETPEEAHAELVKHFLQLKAEGYLRHIELEALPSPDDYGEEADD
jgi:hypothetical protein